MAPEPGTQRRPPTADFTIPWRVAALEPQVSLAIQLVLQVMSESVIRRIVAGAAERAVASAPHCLPVDHHRVPLASVCAVNMSGLRSGGIVCVSPQSCTARDSKNSAGSWIQSEQLRGVAARYLRA